MWHVSLSVDVQEYVCSYIYSLYLLILEKITNKLLRYDFSPKCQLPSFPPPYDPCHLLKLGSCYAATFLHASPSSFSSSPSLLLPPNLFQGYTGGKATQEKRVPELYFCSLLIPYRPHNNQNTLLGNVSSQSLITSNHEGFSFSSVNQYIP